jgi:antitoxin PrlF
MEFNDMRSIPARRNLAHWKEYPYYKEIPYCVKQIEMITSKLTSKSQTTVPQPVRRALNLKPGDLLAYEISDGRVILNRALTEAAADDPFGSFGEWRGNEDETAYADL